MSRRIHEFTNEQILFIISKLKSDFLSTDIISNQCKLRRMRVTFREQFKCELSEIQINGKIKYPKKKYSEDHTLNNIILKQIVYTKY